MENTDEFLFAIVYRVWKLGIPFKIEAAQLVGTHSINDGIMWVIPSVGHKMIPSTILSYGNVPIAARDDRSVHM